MFGKKKQDKVKVFKELFIMNGLDVPEKSPCIAELSTVALTLKCSNKEYVLNLNSIVNFEYQMDVDIKQYTKNGSLAKGVVGAAAFGAAGAIIGASPKTKDKREVTGTIVITYRTENGMIKIIVKSAPNTLGCAGLSDAIKPKLDIKTQRIVL